MRLEALLKDQENIVARYANNIELRYIELSKKEHRQSELNQFKRSGGEMLKYLRTENKILSAKLKRLHNQLETGCNMYESE